MSKVLIINPGTTDKPDLCGIEPPLWCAMLASQIKDSRIVDMEVEDLELRGEDIIHIMVMGANPSASSTPKMDMVRKIVKKIRRGRKAHIVLRGLSASAPGGGAPGGAGGGFLF